jgi:eukaryotic-like serine/threonine-protein kinase
LALTAGTRLGPYEIVSALGAGGMGEVYRARDAKLDRDVAIKVLPAAFVSDPERVARFQREAKTLASLNHPNIAAIYGLDESDGAAALVLELVEGPTLADRIAQGPIPLDEALPIARQIADALEAAHEHGIIHRDLKPANIKLRPDGAVKVLDFGLAKALAPDPGSATGVHLSQPTITSPAAMTGAGMLLGTAAYMSPEQAKARPADKRSDVWAFGCVLYEMLTGARAFASEDVSDTLAFVLTKEPDWTRLSPATPAPIRRLLRRCLDKDRKRRLDSAAAARLEIDDALTAPTRDAPADTTAGPRAPLWRQAIPAAAVVIAGLAGYAAWTLNTETSRVVSRYAIVLDQSDRLTFGQQSLALSPDGTGLAYVANNRMYLRAFDQLDATPIAGVESTGLAAARTVFFSPDSQWLGFWEAGQLKKVSRSGGAPVALCAITPPPYGASWADDNTILVGHGAAGILRVSGNGGTLEPIIKVDAGQRAFGPQLLPDGRTVLFTLAQTASWDEAQIVVQSLDTGTRKTLVAGGTDGRYLATGHLIYALRGTVLAVPFDTTSLSIRGGPVPLVEGVSRQQGARSPDAQFSVASNGTLAYVPPSGDTATRRTLVWVDRRGREEAIPGQPRLYSHPRIAPDGTRLALEIQDDNQNRDIWVSDFTERLARVTSEPAIDRLPLWTPDGQRVIFSSSRSGVFNLYWQAPNGTGAAERLFDSKRLRYAPQTISPDGRHLVLALEGGPDLVVLDLGDGRGAQAASSLVGQPRPLLQTSFAEVNGEISPDGRWLAYQSNRSGVFEVYARPFPDVPSDEWPVSTGGGTEPLWARDGRELFYRSPTGAVMRVSIAPGSTSKAGTPTRLFEATSYVLAQSDIGAGPYRTYDVSLDGRRFLMIKNSEAAVQPATAPRIVVVQNWFEELKSKVPTK